MTSIAVTPLSSFAQIRGLIGYKNPRAVLLKTRFGIHTFGLRFPIDVLILDDRGKVADLRQSLFPNKVFFWNPHYHTVLELPEGTIATKKIVKGSRLEIHTA